MHNINLGATYSVLCSTAHKTDAATGEHGDLLDVISHVCNLDGLHNVEAEARRFLGLPRPQVGMERTQRQSPAPVGSPEAARRLIAISQPIVRTLVETYLRGRAITNLYETGSLHFHPRCYYRPESGGPTETWPAMIAAVTDLNYRITGAHRTWLNPTGFDPITLGKAPIESPRRAMGHLLGNAVRFGIAQDVAAAGEGIETVLSLRCVIPGMPMMAALSAAHLAAIAFPPTLRRLYVVRDNDPAGDGALVQLLDRAHAARIEAVVLSPQNDDLNADLRHFGIEVLQAAIRVQLVPEDVARFMRVSRSGGGRATRRRSSARISISAHLPHPKV